MLPVLLAGMGLSLSLIAATGTGIALDQGSAIGFANAEFAAEALADPAFGAHHALLHLECAAGQLQEPGAVSAAGHATAVGCMSWALQQGKAAASALPAYAPPAG